MLMDMEARIRIYTHISALRGCSFEKREKAGGENKNRKRRFSGRDAVINDLYFPSVYTLDRDEISVSARSLLVGVFSITTLSAGEGAGMGRT